MNKPPHHYRELDNKVKTSTETCGIKFSQTDLTRHQEEEEEEEDVVTGRIKVGKNSVNGDRHICSQDGGSMK